VGVVIDSSASSAFPSERVLTRLTSIVGANHVVTDPDQARGYCVDWSGRFVGTTPAVVRPGTTEEVAAVLALCSSAGLAVVPQGGNTGLVGGAVPLSGEVVVSLRRLDSVGAVDPLSNQITCGAGVTLSTIHSTAAAHGLCFGVDLGARDSATIGGMVATNAGGINVVRYGPMRDQVAGVECVLSDGSILSHLAGLAKDNTGYNIDALMCGSEGTLGVLTRVRLQLHPELSYRTTVMISLGSIGEAVELASHLQRGVPDLLAIEVMPASALSVVSEVEGIEPPVSSAGSPSRVCLLVEAGSSRNDPTDELASSLAAWHENLDVAVATDTGSSKRLWRFRESITESINQLGVPHKFDVTLAPGSLHDFEREVHERVRAAAPGARVVVFGHLGDGNLHVNVLGLGDGVTVDAVVLGLVAEHGGSISAEHGVGTAKVEWLHLSRSQAEIASFLAIRRALDPAGILNPNVLVPTTKGVAEPDG